MKRLKRYEVYAWGSGTEFEEVDEEQRDAPEYQWCRSSDVDKLEEFVRCLRKQLEELRDGKPQDSQSPEPSRASESEAERMETGSEEPKTESA